MKVSNDTKLAFTTSSTTKNLIVTFPNLGITLTDSQICEESMSLTERLMDDEVAFVGCFSSVFSIELRNVDVNLKNQYIVVKIQALLPGKTTEIIPLFTGYVDSVEMSSGKKSKKVTAYDALYTKGQMDVGSWYNSLPFPVTLGEARKRLFQFIGLEHQDIKLPNDFVTIKKEYEQQSMKCLTVLKSFCQINGCCGIINRSGIFEYRFLAGPDAVYPSVTLFPPFHTIENSEMGRTVASISETFAYYKNIDYQEFSVKPVERLQIRDSDGDAGVVVGNPTGNMYIIQSNMFTYRLDKPTLIKVAKNIFKKIYGVSFHPCDTDNDGLPFIEVGDMVAYDIVDPYGANTRSIGNSVYSIDTFNVMSREIRGIQNLRDNYTANGSEEQSVFITDLQAQLDAIKRGGVNLDNYYTKEEVDFNMETALVDYIPYETAEFEFGQIADYKIAQMETPTEWGVASVNVLPPNPLPNTLYLIRCGVTVI